MSPSPRADANGAFNAVAASAIASNFRFIMNALFTASLPVSLALVCF